MFNNDKSNLNKLRAIKSKIKKYQDVMSKYTCPTTRYSMSERMSNDLRMLMNGTMDIDVFIKYEQIDIDYLEELGTYFVNLAKYQKDTQKYQEELNELKKKEQELKAALGID